MRRWIIVALLAFFLGASAGFAVAVSMVDLVSKAQDDMVVRTTWGPDIQECDKELWLRIKDGC